MRTLVGHAAWVSAVALTPNGLQALSGSYDGTLKLWDLRSGQEWRTITDHSGPVQTVAVTADGRQALSASADFTLKLWDLITGKRLWSLSGHLGVVRSVAVTPDGRRGVIRVRGQHTEDLGSQKRPRGSFPSRSSGACKVGGCNA